MTESTSQSDRRRVREHRRQSGFGLLEALIGMVMVALLIGAGTTGLRTLQNTSRQANQVSRLDALLVASTEAVKRVPYVNCAEPAAYEASIADSEVLRVQSERYVQTTASGTPVVSVTGVDGGPGCSGTATTGDAGIQKVSLKVTSNGNTRSATVTKINPDKRLRLPKAVIDPAVIQSSPGDVRAIFSLTAKQSTAPEGFLSLEWDCGPSAEAGFPSTAVTYNPADQVFCRYQARPPDPSDPDSLIVIVTLKVTDQLGQTNSTQLELEVEDRDDPRQQPVAKATTSIAEGNAPVVATFSSAGSTAPSGVIKSYLWEFDDDGSESTEASPTHTFNDAGTYNVKLTVTDDVGLKGVAIVQVKAIILGTLPPKVSFVQPPQQFAPANITFNATAVTYGGSSVAGYLWSFGDGETSTAESPTHTYKTAGNYDAQVTVTDSGGRTKAANRVVTVKALGPPSGFRVTGAEPWAIFSRGSMSFAWDKLVAPGEDLKVQIEIFDANTGTICWSDSKTRLVELEQGNGPQTYRWRDDSSLFGDHFCLGTMFSIRARMVKDVSGIRYEGTPWSSDIFKRVEL